MKKSLIGTACILASGCLMAASMPIHHPMPTGPYGWYAGIGINHHAIMSETGSSNNTAMAWKLHESHPSWELFAGYRLSKYFGNELMYTHIGRVQYKAATNNVSSETTGTREESTYDRFAISYDVLAFLPLHQYFELFAKTGVNWYYARSANTRSVNLTAYDKNAKISMLGGNFGAGLQFNWRMLAARVSYTNYEALMTATTQAQYDPENMVALDVLYRFG